MGKDPGLLTALRKTKYLGSHPSATGQAEDIDIEFRPDGVHIVSKRGQELGTIPWVNVTELAADDRESLERRLTGPRLLLLGAFAFVAKKETVVSYLVVRDVRGDWVFAIPKLSQIELKSGLNGLRKYVPTRAVTAATAMPANDAASFDAKARLQRLVELRDAGLLDDDEYTSTRAAIISGL